MAYYNQRVPRNVVLKCRYRRGDIVGERNQKEVMKRMRLVACISHLKKIQIKLVCSLNLRFSEKIQRLVFRSLTCSAHCAVRRKTPALSVRRSEAKEDPVVSNNTKPASPTYGLTGLKDWCDRQFAAECSI